MNLLDENVPESQRRLLRSRRVSVRQVGLDVGRKGMKDDEIISLLHQSDRLTFFTLDADFYDRRLCHAAYCLVYLDVEDELIAETIRRFLRHRGVQLQS
jgi:predicted nuclease of predicted toxin-antitoxin system